MSTRLQPEPVIWQLPAPVQLACGQTLPEAQLIYETYGTLSPAADNAILICHALSGNHHAAGYYKGDDHPGWWDELIGPGKAMDTERFFIVSLNNLGGCHGSTGPLSPLPASQKDTPPCYGNRFPQVRVDDWVQTQAQLADHLGIARWYAVAGGSLGGMQALEWAVSYPQRIQHCIAIAAATSLSTQNIAFNTVARKAIQLGGARDGAKSKKSSGMHLARMLGHLTYLSEEGLSERFGRETSASAEDGAEHFSVESYLDHLSDRFMDTGFSEDTYLLMTHALDHFDLAKRAGGDLTQVLSAADCRFLVISFDSDWRFPPARSRELTSALLQAGKRVSMLEIASDKGHDSFLFALPRYEQALKTFLADGAGP